MLALRTERCIRRVVFKKVKTMILVQPRRLRRRKVLIQEKVEGLLCYRRCPSVVALREIAALHQQEEQM